MTRSKITHGFDTKLTYAVNDSNQLSWRLSFQRPEVIQLPPADYGDWGGPLGGGFMATGTNKTYSTALNWTHTFSNTFLMEARGGVSYYRNQAVTTANGQALSDQLGIKGVNLGDDWTSGPDDHQRQQRLQQPGAGLREQPAVGPVRADVGVRLDVHEAERQPHDQVRRRLAAQHRHAAADSGQPGHRAAATPSAARRPARRRTRRRTTGSPTPSRASCSTSRAASRATSRSSTTRARSTGRSSRSSTTSGRRPSASRSTSACAGSTTRRLSGSPARAACRTTTRPPTTLLISGYGNNPLNVGVKKRLQQLRAAPGRVVPPRRQDRRARRLRRQHDAVPRQPLRVQLPGQAEQQLPGPEQLLAGGQHGGRFPGDLHRDHPGQRVIPANTALAHQPVVQVRADRPAAGHDLLVQRRVPARAVLQHHRGGGVRRQLQQRRAEPDRDERRHDAGPRQRGAAALQVQQARRRRSRTWRGRARRGTTGCRSRWTASSATAG